MTIDVGVDVSDLRVAVESVWNDTLGLIVDVAPPSFGPRPAGNLLAWVEIGGAFEGVLTVQTADAFVGRAAAVMFGTEPGAVTREEMHDALGELANMLGGMLKPQLPGPSSLSLPSVADGDAAMPGFPNASVLVRVELTCIGEPVHVVLLARR